MSVRPSARPVVGGYLAIFICINFQCDSSVAMHLLSNEMTFNDPNEKWSLEPLTARHSLIHQNNT